MNVYYTTGFEGHNPVGTAAMVVARDRGHARRLLDVELKSRGLEGTEPDAKFVKIDVGVTQAIVLNDGEY
jgi:hypothetical protein